MAHSIKTVYIVHHSHTDIGYTDLQERVIDFQVDHIRSALQLLTEKENYEFRWNCETYYCVERFLEQANEEERKLFFDLVREGRIGISATYLNFNDLVDASILKQKTKGMIELFAQQNITVKTAMNADINGISMGQRDALLDNGIEFLFTNIHTHHGMYPLYQNQNAYWWEAANGKRLLVWNGEHYNLGNALGLKENKILYYMENSYFGNQRTEDAAENLHKNLDNYLTECEEAGYPYDFIISGVSGVFSDNAPPNPDIMRTIETYRKRFGNEVQLKMVTLNELYTAIRGRLGELPVYKGDLNDWWANGVGSTPGAVKHYRAAQKMYHLADKLDHGLREAFPEQSHTAEDNLLLYAEHTWGHSATVTNPYDTFVLDLDMRKNSYASKAHEAAALLLNRAMMRKGGTLRYYNTSGTMRAVNPGNCSGTFPVEFYIETPVLTGARLVNTATKEEMTVQLSSHPRGVLISFTDRFAAGETKEYSYEEIPAKPKTLNSRHAYVGAERVRDIVNDYEPETYRLPYELENDWFRICYTIGEGFTSFYNKKSNCEMLTDGLSQFFTPIYERTELREDAYTERARLGRNIRGVHAQQFAGKLKGVKCINQGEVYTTMEFAFDLEGTRECFMLLRMYRNIPRIDFTLRIAKEISNDIESVYLPLNLALPQREVYIKKGTEPFRPGIDQLPGTCMEYWMTDVGTAYINKNQTVQIFTPDTPLIYMGEMRHHPILLCNNKAKNNQRDVYSWIMNNTWETNFKMDLSGFYEFCYRLELSDKTSPEECFCEMDEKQHSIFPYMVQ